MNNYKLYVHIAPNGKRYYGITRQDPKRRWLGGGGYSHNKYFARAIKKYGWNKIEHIVLFDSLTEHEAKELEQYFIQWYNTANPQYGYNITLGGESCNGLCGEKNPMYGKHHSEQAKQKISETHKGKHLSEEHKQVLKDREGAKNPKAKPVICVTTKKVFLTAKDGADYYKAYKASRTNITQCCINKGQGKYKSSGKLSDGTKLVWRYVNYKHNKTYRVATIDYDHILFDVSDDVIIDYDNII